MISEARQTLTDLITEAGVACSSFVPERVTPPLAIVSPSSTWVESGESFGEFRVSFDTTLVAQMGSNAKVTESIDALLETVLVAVQAAPGFYSPSISSPQVLAVNNAEFLSVQMTIVQIVRL